MVYSSFLLVNRAEIMDTQANHKSVVKAVYDYDAGAPGELSVKEDDVLLVFDNEDDWLLVQNEKEDGKVGFVPGNYVEEVSIVFGAVLITVINCNRLEMVT